MPFDRYLIACVILFSPALAAAGDKVDFGRDIRPILSNHCFKCHGPAVQKGKLRLDDREGATKKGTIVPGKPDESELLARIAKPDSDELRMPPREAGDRLSPDQAAKLKAWIEQGAESTPHWAFVPPVRPTVPNVNDANTPIKNAIDAFVLARLKKDGLQLSPVADKSTLIRRLTLDLTGLLPTPKEVDEFLKDESPRAYENVVDRLLASPNYGERQARHWLDLARYADSNGYTIDGPRSIWPYRDWVIKALNEDRPFDQFTIEQLAGDLLPNATISQRIATGFHRNTSFNEEGGTDPEQFRVERTVDRANTTGSVWLGLTVGCAQCHNHKYDPFTQKDYYSLYAFFDSCEEPTLPIGGRPDLEQTIAALQVMAAYTQKTGDADGFKTVNEEIKKIQSKVPTTLVMRERAIPRQTFIQLRGEFLRKGDPVQPSYPVSLARASHEKKRLTRLDLAEWLVSPENPLTARVTVNREWQKFFGRGLVETENDFGLQGSFPTHPELLDWLAVEFMEPSARPHSPSARPHPPSARPHPPTPSPGGGGGVNPNPLSPRERGMGGEGGGEGVNWSLKRLHKLIVTSATYRQSSDLRKEWVEKDPRNLLLGRQSRLRLEAEAIRDVSLCASGLFNPKIGGPGVYPPQPREVFLFTQSNHPWVESKGEDRYRRGMYTFIWRQSQHPLLTTFDAADAQTSCTRRNRSNTPLQALHLANDPVFTDLADGLGKRIDKEQSLDDLGKITFAFRVCFARDPNSRELARLQTYLEAKRKTDPKTAWTAVARVLMNLDEFITRE